MQLFDTLTNENFTQCWESIEKEVVRRDRAHKISHIVAIPGMITLAIVLLLISACLTYLLSLSEKIPLCKFALLGQKLYAPISNDRPVYVIILILLGAAIVLPFVVSLIARIAACSVKGRYPYDDKPIGIPGAEKMRMVLDRTNKKIYDADGVWDKYASFWIVFLYSLILIVPCVITLIYGYTARDTVDMSFSAQSIMLSLFGLMAALICWIPIRILFFINGLLSQILFRSPYAYYTFDIINYYINKETEAQKKLKKEQELKAQQEQLMQDLLEGEKIYQAAIASIPVDEEAIKKAASLGHPGACCHMGKKLLSAWLSDTCSEAEKEEKAKDAAKYFDVARQLAVLAKTNAQTECTFLWLFSRMQYDIHTLSEWQETIGMLRSIKKAGKLPDEYQELLSIAIQTAANEINYLDKPARTHTSSSTTTSWHTGVSSNQSPGLNTYMTISGTNEFVYYKNGEYVDSNGNPVPKNRIDP